MFITVIDIDSNTISSESESLFLSPSSSDSIICIACVKGGGGAHVRRRSMWEASERGDDTILKFHPSRLLLLLHKDEDDWFVA